MTKYISKQDLKVWLETILKDNYLIAPVAVEGITIYQPVDRAEQIAFNFTNTAVSPKGWFFPETEVLHGEEGDGHKNLKPETLEKNAVIFGIRPCDAKGLTVTDKVFLLTPGDTAYIERRKRTTLIGLACLKERPECFCTRMGSTPNDPSNVDILLTESGEGYLVQVKTEKGSALIRKAQLEDSDQPLPPVAKAKPLSYHRFGATGPAPDMEYWDNNIGARCIHCNVCAFVCPTCYCFQTFDTIKDGKVERLRSWYTCQSPNFDRIQGYMVDPPKGIRIRHRFYHKLPIFPENGSGYATCTGCGRCVIACPVNIDIREIMDDVEKLHTSAPTAQTTSR
jgi:ferredoxin